jgi:hypothetical protein
MPLRRQCRRRHRHRPAARRETNTCRSRLRVVVAAAVPGAVVPTLAAPTAAANDTKNKDNLHHHHIVDNNIDKDIDIDDEGPPRNGGQSGSKRPPVSDERFIAMTFPTT